MYVTSIIHTYNREQSICALSTKVIQCIIIYRYRGQCNLLHYKNKLFATIEVSPDGVTGLDDTQL